MTGPVERAGDRRGTVFKTLLNGTPPFASYQGMSTPTLGASYVQLASGTNYSSWTAVFDSYKIDKVEFVFRLRNAGSSNEFPRLALYPDWDDSTAPASLANVYSHPRVKTWTLTPTKPEAKLVLVPKIAVAAYSGVFTSYAQNDKPMWVDCNSPNVAHYGIKFGIENFTDTSQYIDLFVRFWVTFREPL